MSSIPKTYQAQRRIYWNLELVLITPCEELFLIWNFLSDYRFLSHLQAPLTVLKYSTLNFFVEKVV
jgi:hypothetical protein